MSKNTLRSAILIFGLVTGIIHAVILNVLEFDWLMLLNGLGFLTLTWVVFTNPGFLKGQRVIIHYFFMLFTLVTIVGFFVLNDSYGVLGIIAKVDEFLLLISLWMHLNK
jgi:hypothetical protein